MNTTQPGQDEHQPVHCGPVELGPLELIVALVKAYTRWQPDEYVRSSVAVLCAGHGIADDNPAASNRAVREFLTGLPSMNKSTALEGC